MNLLLGTHGALRHVGVGLVDRLNAPAASPEPLAVGGHQVLFHQ